MIPDAGAGPHFRLYVTVSGLNEVVVIDPVQKRIVQRIPVGVFPQGLSVDQATGRVFVANRDGGSSSVIDGATGEVLQTIPVGNGPGDAEYNPRNRLLYVPNGTDNSISVVKPN
ncbi:MAG: YncE family protein [Gemmatimonadales bacterium]